MKERQEKVEFMPPKGFAPPEGTDGKFSLVCDFEVNDGKLCMTRLGDTDMPGYGENEDKEDRPSYSDYAGGMMKARGNDAQQANPAY